jgi:hypothetical protein
MDSSPLTKPVMPTTDRLWPSRRSLALSVSLSVASLILLVATLLSREWFVVLIALAVLAWAIFTFGWVDLELGRLTQTTAFGRTVVFGNEVASFDIGSSKSKSTKWWFPIVILHDGSSVELRTLKTVSRNKAQSQTVVISHTLGRRIESDAEEDIAPAPPGLVAPQESFTPLSGLDHIYHPD